MRHLRSAIKVAAQLCPGKRNILHRALIVVCALAVLGGGALYAQRKRSTGPRAVALLELASNGRARLVPVAIMVNGKFYDAGLYRATPRPMALDEGTVYEAERTGDPVGLFTVTDAKLIKGVYVGVGQWRANNAPQPEPEKAVTPPKQLGDEPPVLRKPKPASTETKPAEPPPTTATKPPETAKEQAKPQPAPAPPPEDTHRPILRRGKPTQPLPEDEELPTLLSSPGAAPVSGAQATGAKGKPAEKVEVLTAVSDAGGPEARSYAMQLTADERAKYEKALRALAYEAIRKYAAARPQHRPAGAEQLADVQFRALDVHYNNEPVVLLSASLPEAPQAGARQTAAGGATQNFRYWTTVAARWDMYGEMHTLLAHVTDTQHLDAYGRLELVDAVDAEGNGDGELLFRKVSDTGFSYVLYRAGADQLWELFATAERSF